MKKNISRNPLWPDWYNGKKIDEVQFGRAFLEQWPLKCVNGTLYTLDGPVEDESEIKQRILENIFAHDALTDGFGNVRACA
jgi:putative DNA primase/helicase